MSIFSYFFFLFLLSSEEEKYVLHPFEFYACCVWDTVSGVINLSCSLFRLYCNCNFLHSFFKRHVLILISFFSIEEISLRYIKVFLYRLSLNWSSLLKINLNRSAWIFYWTLAKTFDTVSFCFAHLLILKFVINF